MTKDEAMKLALEALEWINRVNAMEYEYQQKARESLNAIYEALDEQETVLPGGGHVPAVPVAVYGYCPECGGAGVMRERRPNGDDKCTNGHKYPSSKALAEQPAQQPTNCRHCGGAANVICAGQCKEQPAQQEPVAWPCLIAEADFSEGTVTLAMQCTDYKVSAGKHWLSNTPPAQRTWVGLTEPEINYCYESIMFNQNIEPSRMGVYLEIETKLKEKNT